MIKVILEQVESGLTLFQCPSVVYLDNGEKDEDDGTRQEEDGVDDVGWVVGVRQEDVDGNPEIILFLLYFAEKGRGGGVKPKFVYITDLGF